MAASGDDALLSVSSLSIEFWEDGCKILNVKPLNVGAMQERMTAEIDLACSGEGMTWRERDIWHLQTINSRKQFITVTIRSWDWRGDTGKPIKKQNKYVGKRKLGMQIEMRGLTPRHCASSAAQMRHLQS